MGLGRGLDPDPGLGQGSELLLGLELLLDSELGLDLGLGLGSELGLDLGLELGSELGLDLGLGLGEFHLGHSFCLEAQRTGREA